MPSPPGNGILFSCFPTHLKHLSFYSPDKCSPMPSNFSSKPRKSACLQLLSGDYLQHRLSGTLAMLICVIYRQHVDLHCRTNNVEKDVWWKVLPFCFHKPSLQYAATPLLSLCIKLSKCITKNKVERSLKTKAKFYLKILFHQVTVGTSILIHTASSSWSNNLHCECADFSS